MSFGAWPADARAGRGPLEETRLPRLREIRRALTSSSPAGAWPRISLAVGAAAGLAAILALVAPWPHHAMAADLLMVLAPLAASAACLGARRCSAPGGRATWLLIGLGALLAALGQALAARAQLVGQVQAFPSPAFHLFIAFHIAFAEGAILALRPAHEPRLALEIALDGLLVLLAASALVLRFILDGPLTQGWISLPQAVAMLLGQFAVAASLFFVALLVFWRDSELSGPVVDGLLVSALFFAFGNFMVALGLDPLPDSSDGAVDLIRLGGWVALTLTAGLAVVRPGPAPLKSRRELAARRFRQLIIPGAAIFMTWWALDEVRQGGVTEPAMAVFGAMGAVLALRIGAALVSVERESEDRRRAESLAARARLRAVTAQMSPHFLFNALHSLSALVRRDAGEAERALERLGGLLRYGIRGEGEGVVLEDEWRFARDYLDLEALRLGSRLYVSWDVDPEAMAVRVPRFILQPLVENAVRHGVSPFPRGGSVAVRARVETSHAQGPRLVLEVADSGPGADPEDMAQAPGVGMRGVRAQLQTHFGDQWSMEAERVGREFVVRLSFPAESD